MTAARRQAGPRPTWDRSYQSESSDDLLQRVNRAAATPVAVRLASIRTMASVIKTVTWDCSDALALARFWAAALGSDVDEDSTHAKAYVEAAGWGAPNMWFNQVPEPKTAKNRLHFDLRAPGDVNIQPVHVR